MAISDYIIKRVEDKKTDYTKYGFTRVESNATKTFFDLAQEFESIQDVYQVSVAIPKVFFHLNARLYVMDFRESSLALVASTEEGQEDLGTPPPPEIKAAKDPYFTNHALVLAIPGNRLLIKQLPLGGDDKVIGILEVYPCGGLDGHQELFFQKYANRIGFSIHMRFLLEKNVEHVKFIKSLVTDIEHNVIVPNMIYRLFLRRLRGKILKNKEIEGLLGKFTSAPGPQLKAEFEPLLAELTDVNRGLMEELGNIEKHHQSSSLFLETLLRRSHFDEGRLTLRTVSCDMSKAVIVPQLEQFADRFAEREIRIVNTCGGIPDEEPVSAIDVGLMTQVYSNLLSNALKYTREVITEEGEREKYIACGKEILNEYFGQGEDGIKYSLFSTGPNIPSEECQKIFDEGYRGAGAANIPGTGHGLAFVKNAVEIHGGVAGHEATKDGNNFYIIIRQG